MKSDLYLREPAEHRSVTSRGTRRERGERQCSAPLLLPHPPTAFILVSSELFSECLPGKFNGCGIWTGKKRRWKFQRKRGFVPHEGSTSVCVLPGRFRGRGHERRRGEEERQRAFPANMLPKLEMGGEGGFQSPDTCMTTRRTIQAQPCTHTHTRLRTPNTCAYGCTNYLRPQTCTLHMAPEHHHTPFTSETRSSAQSSLTSNLSTAGSHCHLQRRVHRIRSWDSLSHDVDF